MNSTTKSWILALRPKTLTAAVVPVLVGMSLGGDLGVYPTNWWIALVAIVSSIFIQISTNLVNDALDFKKGTDTKKRLGPVRVSASGLIKPETVLKGAYLAMFLAALFGIPLLIEGGMAILWIGIASLIAAYLYTGGPYPLAYRGLGDLFVILFFGLVAVTGSFYLQVHVFDKRALVAGLQVGMMAAVLIAINNLRDVEEDSKNQKNTLAVRFGATFVRLEILLLNLVALSLVGYWYVMDYKFWWLPIIALPLMINVVVSVFKTPPSAKYNQFLAQASAAHFVFGLAMTLCFVLGMGHVK